MKVDFCYLSCHCSGGCSLDLASCFMSALREIDDTPSQLPCPSLCQLPVDFPRYPVQASPFVLHLQALPAKCSNPSHLAQATNLTGSASKLQITLTNKHQGQPVVRSNQSLPFAPLSPAWRNYPHAGRSLIQVIGNVLAPRFLSVICTFHARRLHHSGWQSLTILSCTDRTAYWVKLQRFGICRAASRVMAPGNCLPSTPRSLCWSVGSGLVPGLSSVAPSNLSNRS